MKKKIVIDGVEVTGKPSATIRLHIEADIDLSDALYSGIEELLDEIREVGSAEVKSAEFVEEP